MRTLFTKRRPPPGSRPGTLSIDKAAEPTRVHLVRYDADDVEAREIPSPEQIDDLTFEGTLWLDVRGLGGEQWLRALARRFSIHPLALEDIVHVPQRPKWQRFDDHELVVARMLRTIEGEIDSEQVTFVLGEGWILSFQERDGDVFDPVRARLRDAANPIRASGAGYMLYALVDAVVDAYYPAVEAIGERLEVLESETLLAPTPELLHEIASLRTELLLFRRSLWAQRDTVGDIARGGSPLIGPEVKLYFRDVHDHCIQSAEVVESYRELVSGLTNTYLTAVSNRQNEIVKVLTIITTIFIPLSFVAGVYGMNFEHMPELDERWAYPAVLGVMLSLIVGMLVFFWRRGWLGERLDTADKD